MSRRRQLSEEERALWSGVARSITPLRGGKKSVRMPVAGGERALEPPTRSAKPLAKPRAEKPRAQAHALPLAKSLPLAPLGRRLKQRVARGRESIDARLDLHGMTQSEAHTALLDFLQRARSDGARIVLVVTGKGARSGEGNPGLERGVLKRQVPNWLSLPEFRALVIGFEDAHVGHGGQGALYVRLRRQR
jgi:DNA-nicking Smr family endonuclease